MNLVMSNNNEILSLSNMNYDDFVYTPKKIKSDDKALTNTIYVNNSNKERVYFQTSPIKITHGGWLGPDNIKSEDDKRTLKLPICNIDEQKSLQDWGNNIKAKSTTFFGKKKYKFSEIIKFPSEDDEVSDKPPKIGVKISFDQQDPENINDKNTRNGLPYSITLYTI